MLAIFVECQAAIEPTCRRRWRPAPPPYGYTLTIWTSAAVVTHARGIPTALDALLFLAGAVLGFATVGTAAHGSASQVLRASQEPTVRLWGGFHLPSVGLAIAGAHWSPAWSTGRLPGHWLGSSRPVSTCS